MFEWVDGYVNIKKKKKTKVKYQTDNINSLYLFTLFNQTWTPIPRHIHNMEKYPTTLNKQLTKQAHTLSRN